MQPLPIDAVLPDLVDAVRAHGCAVLRAPTGAGKTTRVPPALLDACEGTVVVLEPRRVAARAAARWIARERGGQLGDEVGYHVRFDRRAGPRTRVLAATYGILLRRLMGDAFLDGVGAVVLDEFHERSVEADLVLAMLRRVRETVRPDLRVVAMSATLDSAPLAAYLGDCPVVESAGRLFPIETLHRPAPADRRQERHVLHAVREALDLTRGDLLVFLPGVGEIRRAGAELAETASALGVDVVELYGDLSPERQDAALSPGPRRRVVLATNVAESSLTVPGVTGVVDSGLERVPRVDPAIGLERLEVVRISRESARQRAGRAGRTEPGVCLRLWSQSDRLADRRTPAIRRADLATPVLLLHAWGEADLASFPWFDAPESSDVERAETLLTRLGALQDGRITELGGEMAAMPLHPRLARLLLEARQVGHGDRLALAAAVLSEPGARPRGGPARESPSDVLDRMDASRGVRNVTRARDRLREFAPKEKRRGRGEADGAVMRALLAAYPDRVARRRAPGSDRGVMVGGRGVRLARESAVRDAELFVCVDVDAGRRAERAEALVRVASAIEREWLPADAIMTAEEVSFDAERGVVIAVRRTTYEGLVLDETAVGAPRGPEVERVLAEAAALDPEHALPLETAAPFLARLRSLAAWRPDLGLPTGDVTEALPELCRGRRSFAELRKAPLLATLRGRLTHPQRDALERMAPERLQVPSGNRITLRYEPGRPPVLAVRIQELFGLRETPRVAGVPVLLHLLAPNGRPQQVTDDLASFWANTYAVVRKDLRRRYPKHAWPEDPLSAEPERRPGRRR